MTERANQETRCPKAVGLQLDLWTCSVAWAAQHASSCPRHPAGLWVLSWNWPQHAFLAQPCTLKYQ